MNKEEFKQIIERAVWGACVWTEDTKLHQILVEVTFDAGITAKATLNKNSDYTAMDATRMFQSIKDSLMKQLFTVCM